MKNLKYLLLILTFIFNVQGIILEPISNTNFNGGIVRSSQWITIDNKQFLAAGGQDVSSNNVIRIYNLEANGQLILKTTLLASDFDDLSNIRWLNLNNNIYLAAGGDKVVVYAFNIDTLNNSAQLTQATNFLNFNGEINTLDWVEVNGTAYLAAGGDSLSNQQIKIYEFIPSITPSNLGLLSLSLQSDFSSGTVSSLSWLTVFNADFTQDYFLAVGGSDEFNPITQEVKVYQFTNIPAESLSLVKSLTLNNGNTKVVEWLSSRVNCPQPHFCDHRCPCPPALAVAGNDGLSIQPVIRVYEFNLSNFDLLFHSGTTINDLDATIKDIEWCITDDQEILYVGLDSSAGKVLQAYDFNLETNQSLILGASQNYGPGIVNSVACVDLSDSSLSQLSLFSFIALAGTDTGLGALNLTLGNPLDLVAVCSLEDNLNRNALSLAIKQKYCR